MGALYTFVNGLYVTLVYLNVPRDRCLDNTFGSRAFASDGLAVWN